MGNILNFVFLEDTLEPNLITENFGYGPAFYYLFNDYGINYSYTLNGELKKKFKNILLIEFVDLFEDYKHITDKVINFIKQNNISVLFVSLSNPTSQEKFDKVVDFCKNKKIYDKSIFIDVNTRLKGNVFTLDYELENMVRQKSSFFNTINDLGYISEEIKLEELIKKREKKFLSFNRNVQKHHRFSLLNEYLTNNYNDSYFSFLLKMDECENLCGYDSKYNLKYYNNLLPIQIDTHNTKSLHNFKTSNTFLKEIFLNSYINIVTETSFDGEELFISEKILKPILMYQPFIVMASHGYLNKLKEYGFKTFDSLWDESYDKTFYYKKRIKKIINLIQELNKKSTEEIHQIYLKSLDICIHNKKTFDSLNINDFNKILKKIENE